MKTDEKTHVLLVEDNPTDAYLLQNLLLDITNNHFEVKHVKALREAQDACESQQPDIILLDLSLPDANGLETIREIKKVAMDSPIVVMTGNKDPKTTEKAVQAGAQDLLYKGEYNASFLDKTIRYAIERKQSELALQHLAHFDPLTGIANRVLFIDNMSRALSHSQRHNEMLALMFIDLDEFKNINDTLGHEAGDDLLIQVADRLNVVVRECDTVARLGGDEFAIILEDIHNIHNIDIIAKKILQTLSTEFVIANKEMFISASIGVACAPEAGEDTNTLLKNADKAMYHAKKHGKNRYQIFTDTLSEEDKQKYEMERDLHKALSNNEFELYYQPLFDVESGEIHSVEALLRWNYPKRDNVVPPIEFISVLEQTGLIVPVGEWVLRTACEQCKRWHQEGFTDFRVAVNVSPRQFQQDDQVKWIEQVLIDTQLDGKYLNIEITEDILLDNPKQAVENITRIRNMGVAISIDDFGTGYSSLSYLMNYDLDVLKIDRSFLNTLTTNPATHVILKAIIEMAHGLGLKVTAEGVEKESHYNYLVKQGCDVLQGYLFSKPLDAKSLYDLVSGKNEIKKAQLKAL